MDKEILLNFKRLGPEGYSGSSDLNYECRNCYSIMCYVSNPSYEHILLRLSNRLMNCEAWREKQFGTVKPPTHQYCARCSREKEEGDPYKCYCEGECWH